jgi:hypothetical protein
LCHQNRLAKRKLSKISTYRELFQSQLSCGFQDNEIHKMWKEIEIACRSVFNRSHFLAYHCSDRCRPKCPICEYEKDIPKNKSGL